jgi:hypothetical protein
MSAIIVEPIGTEWTTIDQGPAPATAAEVARRLAPIEIGDLGPDVLPFLAAAAAELASVAGIAWRFSTDDPAVALVRLIAKVTMTCPDAAGPHTARLVARLP